jgi:hypothetical protein
MLLSKFSNEVLSRGAAAVLPQNLPPDWLGHVQRLADQFLDTNFQGGRCKKRNFTADPILAACVAEIMRHQKRGVVDVPEEEMFEKITLYALSVTVETVARGNDLGMRKPTLDTIFDKRRFHELARIRPEFKPILTTVCINEN